MAITRAASQPGQIGTSWYHGYVMTALGQRYEDSHRKNVQKSSTSSIQGSTKWWIIPRVYGWDLHLCSYRNIITLGNASIYWPTSGLRDTTLTLEVAKKTSCTVLLTGRGVTVALEKKMKREKFLNVVTVERISTYYIDVHKECNVSSVLELRETWGYKLEMPSSEREGIKHRYQGVPRCLYRTKHRFGTIACQIHRKTETVLQSREDVSPHLVQVFCLGYVLKIS